MPDISHEPAPPVRIRRVLVATSLDKASDQVVDTAHRLARAVDAELHLFHALPLPVAYYGVPAGLSTVNPETLRGDRDWHRQRVDQQLELLGIAPESVTDIAIEIGAPHRMLIEHARTLEPDLIVMGGSEAEGPMAPLLGSTTGRVLSKSRWPVLVVRGALPLPLTRILAPVDLSPLSEAALRQGLALVAPLEGESPPRVDVLFVLSRTEREGSQQFDPEQIDRFAAAELDRLLERVASHPERLSPVLRTGLPRHEILRHVAEHEADLVLLGTHGHGGFERLLLGSVAGAVAQRSPVSVLVMPPHATVPDEETAKTTVETAGVLGDAPLPA